MDESKATLAHISHDRSATSADLRASAGRAPKIVLDRLQACLRAIFVRAPSIHVHLDAFAANAGEKCGLTHTSHDRSATSADLRASAGRAPKIVLDRLQACLRAIFVRAPSIHVHLDAFAANAGEKCGLKSPHRGDFAPDLAAKVARKQRARRQNGRRVWFGLGMMGLVGWSVAIPTLAGTALGMWLDGAYPGPRSWTLALLVAGLVLGCFSAGWWIAKEQQTIQEELNHDQD